MTKASPQEATNAKVLIYEHLLPATTYVFVPKWRRKALYVQLRRKIGQVFREMALHKEIQAEEGHLMIDHVQMMLSLPPKYVVSQVLR